MPLLAISLSERRVIIFSSNRRQRLAVFFIMLQALGRPTTDKRKEELPKNCCNRFSSSVILTARNSKIGHTYINWTFLFKSAIHKHNDGGVIFWARYRS